MDYISTRTLREKVLSLVALKYSIIDVDALPEVFNALRMVTCQGVGIRGTKQS